MYSQNNRKNSSYPKWIDSSWGKQVKNWEEKTINRMLQQKYGLTGLQIGIPILKIPQNTISGCLFVCNQVDNENTKDSIVIDKEIVIDCSVKNLPFQEHSIDIIIAPHVLDHHPSAELIIREFYRILRPEGYLIISLFNPHSYIRLSRWLMRFLPKNWKRMSATRIKEWMRLLGLEVDEAHYGIYCPTWRKWADSLENNEKTKSYANTVDNICKRWLPTIGAVYIVMIHKSIFKSAPKTEVNKKWTKLQAKPKLATTRSL